jgi:hypothetical protein
LNRCTLIPFIKSLLMLISFSLMLHLLYAEEIGLDDIARNIERYRNKTVTFELRLKRIDRIFDKIIFYDSKNHDIAFDISEYKKRDTFEREILNLHEGMVYLVEFIVKDVGNIGDVIGELVNFEIAILKKLPEGG